MAIINASSDAIIISSPSSSTNKNYKCSYYVDNLVIKKTSYWHLPFHVTVNDFPSSTGQIAAIFSLKETKLRSSLVLNLCTSF